MAEQTPLIVKVWQDIKATDDKPPPDLQPVTRGLRIIGELDLHHRKFYNLLQIYQKQLTDLNAEIDSHRDTTKIGELLDQAQLLADEIKALKEFFWVSVKKLFKKENPVSFEEEVWENYQIAVRD